MHAFSSVYVLALVVLCHSKPFTVEWSHLKKSTLKSRPFSPPVLTNCTKATDEAVINSVTFNPLEPKAGDTLTLEATFFLKENVTSGKVQVDAKYNGINLYTGSIDLCQVAEQVGLSCPLQAGNNAFKVEIQIPQIAPNGNYSGHGTVTDQNGKELACGDGSYTLS